MKLLGFNFTKISIERIKDSVEGLKIETQIDISEIVHVESNRLNPEESVIGVTFKYEVNYNPDLAKIDMGGKIIISIGKDQAEKILKQWKDKKIKADFKIALFNLILRKSNIRALQLEDELNLPLHMAMPSLKKQPSEEASDESSEESSEESTETKPKKE